jgi:outer membrane lipoprotein-sorting protein
MLTAALLAMIAAPGLYAGQTPEDKGLEIVREADRRYTGYGDSTSNLRMILRNKQGQVSERELRIRTLEIPNDGDRSLCIFDSPADVKGTVLLTHAHKLEADDQWLYLPALKRVKRIASANKSGPFVGSEFAYEDLSSSEVEKYSYRWLRNETLDGRDTFVLEEHPAYEYSGYTRRVVWLDQQMYQPLKVEFYDRKDALLKTLTADGYRQYLDRYWRPSSMLMVNHQTGKSTELRWQDYRFGNGLTARDFDQNTLKRSR